MLSHRAGMPTGDCCSIPNWGYALRCGVHLFFAAGYELQRLERLRKYEGRWFSAEFAEQLSHGTLLLKVGVLF